jgi:hypothetical protein
MQHVKSQLTLFFYLTMTDLGLVFFFQRCKMIKE